MGNCIRLAVTGGIGCGKSVVSHILEIMGVPVYDCDRRAKEIMVTDAGIVKGLKRMFGEACYNSDGSLDRAFLASRIFTDDNNIERVNALVHPAVKKDFDTGITASLVKKIFTSLCINHSARDSITELILRRAFARRSHTVYYQKIVKFLYNSTLIIGIKNERHKSLGKRSAK